jgi:hypothetical protein
MTEPTNVPVESTPVAPRPAPAEGSKPPAAESPKGDSGGSGDTRLATYRPDVLVVGDHKITPKGTSVPSSEVDEIKATAAANGVTVYEMES